jgi:hypothetical protein
MISIPSIINSPYGTVKITTFKEFIKLIPRKEWYSYTDKVGFFRRNKDFNVPKNPFLYEETYRYFIKTPITVAELVCDVLIKNNPKRDLIEMVHDITKESALEMCDPTHLVRLGPRFWLAANPEDFSIFFNKYGHALANLKPNKSIAWRVDRISP